MNSMDIKTREQGSISDQQKNKSLNVRWFSKTLTEKSATAAALASSSTSSVRYCRNTIVRLRVSESDKSQHFNKHEDYQVLGVYDKYYNKYFLKDYIGKRGVANIKHIWF